MTLVLYNRWSGGEPNNWQHPAGDEDCVEVILDKGSKWNDCTCEDTENAVVCQYP